MSGGVTQASPVDLAGPRADVGAQAAKAGAVFTILFAVSFSHLLNDMMQSLIPAIYPLLKQKFELSFSQIGLIALAFQLTASILQPVVGMVTDRRPMPFSLAASMAFTLLGLVLLSVASSFPALIAGAATVGLGSSVFHPESSRVARLASGGRHGMAQSLFQVGGNAGTALGPLLAAYIVLSRGQASIAWFTAFALLAMAILFQVGRWYSRNQRPRAGSAPAAAVRRLPRRQVAVALAVLLALMFSKFFYMSSMGNYYTFYLIDHFGLSARDAQLHLFLFLGSVAAGTIIGGPIGDRFGRKLVIWVSILGVLPFTLALPHASLLWTSVLSVAIGLILSSAFSAIVVYAQDLVPGRTGTVSGLFFGFAFGLGGLGAAALGAMADATSIETVFEACAFLPLIGLLTAFLPSIERPGPRPA
jgi:FSR family fosmidomycin resistance protein-like MFS transporter